MSESLLNIYYRETLDKVDSYEEYLSSMINTLDTQEWKKALSVDNQYAYKNYLYKYSNGIHKDEVQKKIDSFTEIEAKEADKRAWEKAKRENSKKSYEMYLKSYYNGIYSNEAKRKVDEFIRLEKEIEQQRLKEIAEEKRLILEKENKKLLNKEYNILLKYSNISVDGELILRKANNLDELKKTTNIQYRNSSSIPESIGNFTNLKILSITYPFRGKVQVEVPLSISELINLEELAISNCAVPIGLSSIFPNFKNLKHLFLHHLNNFKFDSYSAGLLPNLKSLSLADCGLYDLPIEIKNSTKLERVNVAANNLSEIPNFIKYLKELKKLDIYSNDNIKTLPIWLQNLENLEEIDVSYTSISDIPKAILDLKKLKVIYAKGCKIPLMKMGILKMKYKGKIDFGI